MPRVCTICAHSKRVAIERALVAGQSVRGLAKQHGVSHQSLQRHTTTCVREVLAKSSENRDKSIAEDLLSEVETLHRTTNELLSSAQNEGDIRTALAGVREARGNLKLLAIMTGKLQPKETEGASGMVTWEEFVLIYRQKHGISS